MADRRVTRSMTGALTPHQRNVTENIQRLESQIAATRRLITRARSDTNRETHQATLARLQAELDAAIHDLANNNPAQVPIVLPAAQQLNAQRIQEIEDEITNLEVSLIGMIDQVEIARIQATLSRLNNQLLRARQGTATQPNVLLQTYISEIQRYQGLLANQPNHFTALIIETRLNALRYQLSRITRALNPAIRRQPPQRISPRLRDRIANTLEQRINSLYTLNNDISHYFNVEQLSYFRSTNMIVENYYRKLELIYKQPIYEKFNQIRDNVIARVHDDSIDLGLGMQYYNEVYDYYVKLLEEFALVNQPDRIRTMLIREAESNISNEKVIINNILFHIFEIVNGLNPENDNDRVEIDKLNEVKVKLEDRRGKLNDISRENLTQLFSTPLFQQKREYVIIILKAAKYLMRSYLYLMIKLHLNNNVDADNEIRDELFTAVDSFRNLINEQGSHRDVMYSISDRRVGRLRDSENVCNNTYSLVVRNGRTVNTSIIRDFNTLFVELTGRNIVSSIDGQRNNCILNSIEENKELEFSSTYRRLVGAENIWNLERRLLIDERRQARVAARQARIQAQRSARQDEAERQQRERQERRAAEREARAAARAAATAERAAARAAATAARTAARGAPRVPQVIAPSTLPAPLVVRTIENPNIELEFGNRFETSSIDEQYYSVGSDKFINKLLEKSKLNSKYFANESQRDVYYNKLKNEFKTLFNNDEPTAVVYGSVINVVGNSITSLYARYVLNNDMQFNDLPRYYVANFSLIIEDTPTRSNPNKKTYTFERQSGIDVGGLRRDFVTALTNELFDKNIFVSRDGTNKYFLNPEYNPNNDATFKAVLRYIVRDDAKCNRIIADGIENTFYKFLGELLGFIYVNDCGIVNNLSSYLVSNFIKSDFDDHDYVYFMIDDFPEYSKSIINLMKDKDTIEYIGIEYNDTYDLESPSKGATPLDKDNIVDFLIKTAKFMMTKTILRRDIEVSNPNENNKYKNLIAYGEKITSLFIEGIPEIIRQYNENSEFTPKIITSFLVPPLMSEEILNKLIANFTSTMQSIMRGFSPVDTRKYNIMKNSFIEVLKLPTGTDAKKAHFKFIEKLLKFWSGSQFYKEKEKYKIAISIGGLGIDHLPQSHTCFFQIDFPDYTSLASNTIGNAEPIIVNKIREKLTMAVLNVEDGIGMAGGGNRRRTRRKH